MVATAAMVVMVIRPAIMVASPPSWRARAQLDAKIGSWRALFTRKSPNARDLQLYFRAIWRDH